MLFDLYSLIKSVYLLLDDGDQHFFGLHNLTQSQFYALLWLSNSPKSMSELSQAMLCDPSNVTRVADILERKGLISRQRDEQDRRIVRLQLTAVGQQMIDQLHQDHNQYTEQRMVTLSAEERAALFPLLQKFSDDLQQLLIEQKQLRPLVNPVTEEA